eukprot:4629996-Prymnesium_polylepis.2
MDPLSRSIHHAIVTASEHSRIVEAFGSAAYYDQFISNFVLALTRTLVKDTTECKHVLSLYDEEFRMKHSAAIAAGPSWKGRGRDRKGQLFRMAVRDGILHGWSAETHTWVLLVPHALQSVVFNWLKVYYSKCNDSTREAFAKYEINLERDYALTVGERALNRGLHNLKHRQPLNGRRNKFAKAPKPVY